MRVIILAAGNGTRLNAEIPKPMVRVGGLPVLSRTLNHMADLGIHDVTITTHFRPEVVRETFSDGAYLGLKINYSHEEELLGTAGGVKKALPFFNEPFAVWYGDNFSTVNLNRMMEYHIETKADATIAVIWRRNVSQSGVVEMLGNVVADFIEKPTESLAGWVNAGIYILNPSILSMLPERGDFGHDVFPELLAKDMDVHAYGLSYDEIFRWYDTPEDLIQLRKDYP